MATLIGESADSGVPAVRGKDTSRESGGTGGWFESSRGEGVRGVSRSGHAGVVGINNSPDPRLAPVSWTDEWLAAHPDESKALNPKLANVSIGDVSKENHSAESTDNWGGNGGWFESKYGEGVRGVSNSAHGGVVGVNTANGPGVYGTSANNEGVRGVSNSAHGGVLVVLRVVSPEEAKIVYDSPGEPAWASAGKIGKNGQRVISLAKLQALAANQREPR